MKLSAIIFVVMLASCGRESSPDGRSQIRDEEIHKELDSLKDQNKAILDSISSIRKELQKAGR